MSKTVVSLFSGIGGIDLGFIQAGFEVIWANESDKYACVTYRHNFGSNTLVEGDIKSVNASDIPKADIIVAGFPCQSFSLMGYQHGFKDPRGNLFFEIARIADKTGIYRIDDSGVANRKYVISPTLKANMGTYPDRVPIIRDDFGIRKLTPYECLALQGFPKEFVFKGIPLEAAYKQSGNTVCVPVVKRIAERLYKVLD